MNIVLVEPEIPQNTGNIARTCAVTGSTLHLVKPLGFSVDDKHLKRAGLDYWHLLDIYYYDSFQELQGKYPDGKFYYATTKAGNYYTDMRYGLGDFLVFGKETKGLPREIIDAYPDQCIRIPMANNARSMNLANSVAVILYEALRQNGFPGMK
ncbi:MAG: tRNA (uridine(34)/cytosine(34)/5-carboxymethylaminomethyluridine(34)-2'-O)-methyltransferase TrmL [Thermoanaerobacteraceae bacterium]|nr:tRNA (uridine(34)/cytosine(34)/5-carboxymethylaminomethyluridine(34)-2'-O)-methyltransferase TrmL [Thermoanaerobacteraceae bacterium]